MKITAQKSTLATLECDALMLGVFGGKELPTKAALELPEDLRERFAQHAARRAFTGEVGQTLVLTAPLTWRTAEIIVVGLGRKDNDAESIREAIGAGIMTARSLGAKKLGCALIGNLELRANDRAGAIVTATLLADYYFAQYKQANPHKHIDELILCIDQARLVEPVKKAIAQAQLIDAGVSLARDLVNTPAGEMYPIRLAEVAKEIAASAPKNIALTVLDRKACEKLGMGAYLGVAQGSEHEPRFIHLTYTPTVASKKSLAIIGKGITFDSGGLSLKPADGMMTMKCDMAGAAAVLGLFKIIAQSKPKSTVHGIIAAAENMPSGKAFRPGDVVRSMNGKTIEVANTDAEGRLTLADALTYAQTFKPNALIDLATLTGACVVALGEEISGVMSNNDALAEKILTSAQSAGEKMWPMPLEQRYRKLNESDIADLRNIPSNRYGGSLTAGLFLAEFVDNNTPWAHLDIAGPAFAEKPLTSYIRRGGTGHGVRTLVEFVDRF